MQMGFDDLRGLAGAESGTVLRPLHWAEFCARLEAAQDLRRLSRDAVPASSPVGTGLGSFHRVAAWMLREAGSEERVNLMSSTNGKTEESKTVMKPNRPSPAPLGALTRRELP